jgi:hypothetical protein
MGSVVGRQLSEDILDVTLDGFFRNRKLVGDLFVCISAGDQLQDLDFPCAQLRIASMVGKRQVFSAGLNSI